ncbi:MAG: PKD domain-containing protein, partial [Hymenobacter sp.]
TPLLFTACSKKDSGTLDWPAPQPTFTVTTQQSGFTTVATFTNTTSYSGPGIVFYEWDFGDGTTAVGTSATITHTYTSGGTKQAQLLASARGGNGFSPKQNVVVPDASTIVKQLLTGGTSKTWKLDAAATATITVGPNDGDVKGYYAGGPPNSLPSCQSDDEFTFSNANVYTYDAKSETFVAANSTTGVPAHCDTPRSGTSNFTFGSTTSGLAQFVLATPGRFIGVTDAPDLTYRIMSISATNMVLRAGAANANLVFEMKLIAK